jgi:LPXTG-site transpeptidase (sortase) family protein
VSTTTTAVTVEPPVVDLRSPAWRHPEPWPVVAPETAPHVVADNRAALRRRRRIAVAVLLGLVAIVAADFVLGRVIHDQHQRHLAAAMETTKATTVVGDPVMILQIPSIQLNQVVVDGTDSTELRGGPGLVPNGAIPTHRGTAVVVGHYYRYGSPFHDLSKVQKGATAAVQLRDKTVHTYKVVSVAHVAAGDRRPFAPSKAGRLILATDAGYLSDKRVVVTLTPDVAATVGRAPTAPISLAGGLSPISLALVVLLVAAAIGGMVYGTAYMRRRYRTGAVLTCLVPFAGLLVVVVVLCLDLVVSATA